MNNDETGRTLHCRYYIVCVIDVLGQSKRLNDWAKIPPDQATPEFIAAIRDTLGAIGFFKKQFLDYFERFSKTHLTPTQLATMTLDQHRDFHEFKAGPISTRQFSDTFVFFSPIFNKHHGPLMNPVFKILSACSMALTMSLAAKIPVRGGICIGSAIEDTDLGFYGPGLALAHHLESKCAQYPRVIIDRSVIDFLLSSKASQPTSVKSNLINDMAEQCKHMIIKDVDDWHIVDFIGPQIASMLGGDKNKYAEEVLLCAQFVNSQVNTHKNNEKLYQRYKRLQTYILDRLVYWELDPRDLDRQ